MSENLIVSEAARALSEQLGVEVRPRDISTLFYERRLSDDECPVVGGRRLIPQTYLATIADVLRREGKIRGSLDPDRSASQSKS